MVLNFSGQENSTLCFLAAEHCVAWERIPYIWCQPLSSVIKRALVKSSAVCLLIKQTRIHPAMR